MRCFYWNEAEGGHRPKDCQKEIEGAPYWALHQYGIRVVELRRVHDEPPWDSADFWTGPMCRPCAQATIHESLRKEEAEWAAMDTLDRWKDLSGNEEVDSLLPYTAVELIEALAGGKSVEGILEAERRRVRRPVTKIEDASN